MSFSAKARRLPGRLAAGAFILNAGLGKWSADEETAARLHGMAAGTYPFLARLKPKDFARLLSPARSRSARRCCCRSCPRPRPGRA